MPEVRNDKEFLDLHGLERFWNNVKDYLDTSAYTVPSGKQVASVRQDHGKVVVTFEDFGGATGAAKEAARESLGVSSSEEVEEALAGKADLVDEAVEGNLAALDAEGNLVDSGVDPETLKRVQEAWSDEPDSALYTLGSIGQDANGVVSVTFVRIPDATVSSSGLMSSEDKGKLDGLPDETELAGLLAGKADKAVPSAAGNVATLDAEGNLDDSGYSVVDTAGAGFEDNVPTGGAVLEAIGDAVAELDSTGSGSSAHVTVSVVQADGVITDVSVSDTAAAADHVHGNISNDGKVGSASGKYLVTGENGVVEAGDLPVASTSAAGIVRLSSATDSTSETMAATPKAVHDAVQATVAGLDATNSVPGGHYITSVDETDGIVSITTAAMDDAPTQDSSKPVKSGGVFASIGAEANDRAAADAAFQQLIPTAASEYNQLADKAYVDAIGERVEARYLSYSQDGLPFPTYDDFVAAQQTDTFYYMNALTAPNNNDVIVITADRTHLNDNNQPTTTRWRFFKPETGPGEWRYEYTINNSALNEAQLLAINSGINAVKVGNYDDHLVDYNNPHHVNKTDVGLGNVDNTADLDKPISTATQTALAGKADNVVGGTANNIVILGDNGKTLVDSHAAITSSYDGTNMTNPVTGSAVAAAIGGLDAGPFGGEGKYIISVSETAGVVTATEGTLDAEPTENSTNPVKSGGVYQHLATKADRDTEADEDNVAVFDANGNPVDSGISKDALEAAISSAGSSIQGVSIDGTALTPDVNNVVDIPLATTSADGAMSAEDKAKLDGIASGAEANVQSDWTEADSNSDAFIKNKPSLATVATTGEYGDLLNIPTDLVHDASYVHTDNNYSTAEKTKLAGIETGAEVNVQSDWNESDNSSDAFIKNKPENLVQDANYVHTDNNYTTAEKTKLAGIETGAEVNVIETVKVDDTPLTVTNKTVNIDLSGKTDKAVPSAAGNLAGLDATGNLTDSGIAATSVVTDGDLENVIESLDAEVTSNDGTNVQVKVTEVDGKISAVSITTDNTENNANKVTSWSEIPTDAHYPSEKLVKDYLDNKETEYWIHQPSSYMAFVILADITDDYGQSRIGSTRVMTGILEGYRDEWGYQISEVSAIRVNIAYKWDTSDQKCICLESSGVPKMAYPMIIRDARVQNNTKYYFGLRLSTPMMMNFKFTGFKSSVIPGSVRFADINFSDDTVTWIPGDGTNTNFPAGISTVVTSSPIDWQVGKASQLITARELAVLLSNNGTNTVFDGSTAVTNIKVRGTLGIANGGTGATNAADALANLGVTTALNEKADKVASATDGNFAGLDASGNLTDSGKNVSDFATAAQGATADTAVQSVTLDGNELKSGTSVVIPLAGNTAGTGTAGAMSGADKVKLDSVAAGAEVNVQSDWTEADSNSDAFIRNKPANLVQDANYVHTDNNYTTAEKNKLSDIAAGAEVNVQSDWNELDSTSDAYIQNKPANLVQDANYVHTDNNYTTAEKNKLSGIAAGAEVNIQSDWNETNSSSDAYIKNKPTLATVATTGSYNDLTDKPTIPEIPVTDVTVNGTSVVDADGVAEVIVPAQQQADWNQSTTTAVDFIKNKPANLVQDASYVHTDNNYTTAEKNKLSGIEAGAEVNVIETVKVDNIPLTVTDKTVNIDLSGKADKATNLTGATNTKITYNSQGIVTAGADLEASDIPELTFSKITGTLPVDRGGTGATTPAGARTNLDVYSTSDVYTKTEVDSRLSGRVVVVSTLPATGETGIIYYVGPTGTGGDQYEEYIWAKEEGASTESWIKVGEPTIDLSGKADKTVPSAAGNLAGLNATGNLTDSGIAAASVVTDSDLATAIGGLDSNKTSTDGTNVQVKVTETDGKISAVNITTDNTENKNNKITAWSATTTDTHYPSEKLVKASLDGKVDKVEGKGLSTEDYTTAEKTKLAGIAEGAEVNQNAFSNVKVGSTTVAADSKTDTLEIAGGTGIDAVGDTTNDKVTLSLNSATQASLGKADSAVQSVKINGGSELKDASGNVNIPLAVATGSTGAKAGALSADDKKKLNDLGTAAFKNVPASGNASSDEVVLGSDTRLSAGASAVQDVTVDGASVVNSSKVAVVPNASTSAKGAVQLAGSIGATVASENNKAATEKAVRDAINALDSNKTSTDGTNVQVKVTEADGKISAVNITTDNTENRNNKVSTWQTTPDNTHYPTEKLVKDSLDGKASSTHTHGNITNDGKIGSTANLAVVTGTSGAVTTADLTTASPTVPTSGTTTSLEFIDTVAQDSKGKISATKKTVVVDSTYSSTGTNPVNGKAIAAAIGGLDSNETSTDGTNVQVKVTETDGKISAVNVTTDNTENKNNKVTSVRAASSATDTAYPSEKAVATALTGKVDKDGYINYADGKWIGAALSVSSETEVKYWKLCSFTTGGYWTLNFVMDVTNAKFDSDVFERKIISMYGGTAGQVQNAREIRDANFKLYSDRGYGNNIYYKTNGTSITVYIKARFAANLGQYCHLVSVVNATSITNLTWYLETTAGTQPEEPVQFTAGYKVVKPAGSASVPVYIGSDGNPVACTDDFVHDSEIASKANMVSSATAGNFAGLDSNGDLTDSGSKAADFATAAQGSKADSAIQGVKVNNTTLTPDADKVVTVPLATTSADGAMSAADKTKLDGIAAGAEANVQADWDQLNGSADDFIKHKPFYHTYVSSNVVKVVCSVTKRATAGSVEAIGLDFICRRYAGAIRGRLTYKTDWTIYQEKCGDISVASNSVSLYYAEDSSDSSKIIIYAKLGAYSDLCIAPAVNLPITYVNFSNFGTLVESLPEGATEITPVWVANSASSSGTAPVKVDAYGALSAVPMDSTPTASSTNLMTSGAIKTALDGKAASSHTHGNIQNGGTLQTTDVAIASGDKLVITDASDSNKIARSSTAFDGSTITKALTQKGTFESVMLADDAMSLSATDGVKITYSGSAATISGNFAAGAGVGITYANNVATFSADISAIPLATIYALS